VIVPSHTSIDTAQTLFPGASIYTVEEAKGLEFDVVVKYGFYNSDDALLKEVDRVYRNGGYSSSPQNRSKERNILARSNSLYFHKSFVAATRAMSELIIVDDDVAASDSFPSLWEALKGDINVSHEVSTSEQSSLDFSQLPHNEQISILSAKISEFSKIIHDDMARGITRNIDALEGNLGAAVERLMVTVHQSVDTADTETLWSILNLGEMLGPEFSRRVVLNPNVTFEVLIKVSANIKDINIFEILLAREDVLTSDEMKIDFKTTVLEEMSARSQELKGTLSAVEAESYYSAIERGKAEINALFHSLVSRDDLISSDMVDSLILKVSTNKFADTETINILAGRCLFLGKISDIADICSHKNADSVTIEMVSNHLQLQGVSDVNPALLRAVILSPHANEGVILSLIANDKIDFEFKQDAILQSRFRSDSNVMTATISAKRASSAKVTKSEESGNDSHDINTTTEVAVRDKSASKSPPETKQERNERIIIGHAMRVKKMINDEEDKKRFGKAHAHLTQEAIIKFSIKIILASKGGVLSCYLGSMSGRKAFNLLLQAIEENEVVVTYSDIEKKSSEWHWETAVYLGI
ncbi:MAG: hypothetical protein HON32_00505, partial [Francisellaceae bacterium]|nr:hypothetical protein [Francisellaceae bacterium]